MASASRTPTQSQRAAVEAHSQPVLVVAGPGSGKTFCLIERIRFLIEERRVVPGRIIAFTFTNKAAEEIASRLDALGPAAREVKRTTIHKFCVDVLRKHGSQINVDPAFGIADEDYQVALLRELGSSQSFVRDQLNKFARHRLRGDALAPLEQRKYEAYVAKLRDRNMLDFDMLLIRTADALAHADAAALVRGQWDAILVDEFQDLNPVQYSIVHTLAHGTRDRNVFAVGDYDQSIYGWAGADPSLFPRFMNDFGIVKPHYLQENHRTPRDIFEAARRFVEVNPMLPGFDGRPVIAAQRDADHPIEVHAFDNERDEAEWIVKDIREQRQRHPELTYGDFGLLYRTHDIGNVLEPVLLMSGIPCRLAHGRAIGEDPVIAYVVAALGVMLHPADPGFQESFLEKVLPKTLTEWARSEGERRGQSMLAPLKQQLEKKGQHADEIRRAVASLKNLGAYLHRHDDITSLLEELLSRRVGKYRNPLAERHIELDDPELDVEASALAFRLNGILKEQRPVQLPHLGGAEIPMKAMLHELGVRTVMLPGSGLSAVGSGKTQSREPRAASLGSSLDPRTLFKAAQILTARRFEGTFQDFTTFDLETTGLNTKQCEIVEIAAVRVRDGRPVAEFHKYVKPRIPIEPGATAVHRVTEAMVANAPFFEQVWSEFRDFCGDDVLVAHNGEEFDFPVIRRMAKGMPGVNTLATYDSMPLAWEITPTSHKLESLARDYGIDTGRSHSAIDDAKTLALVFARLNREKVTRSRKSCLVQLLDHLGVALALAQPLPETSDAKVLFDVARPFALGIFGDALDYYDSLRTESGNTTLPSKDDVIVALGGHELMERIRSKKTAEERYPASMQRLRLLCTGLEAESRELTGTGQSTSPVPPSTDNRLRQQLATLLERVALSGREVGDSDAGRVNLLTLHATKGLEFSRVYMVGAEDEQFAKERDTRDQLEESRRVFYVGMTRAKDRLVFTRVTTRAGKPTGGTRFLDELGLVTAF